LTWCYLGSATVSEQLGAVDLARRIARQREHGFTDLVRLTDTTERALLSLRASITCCAFSPST
jgi:hypothetical protein